jgi:hypothetical protein
LVPYTLWSRGRLLGESELDYVREIPRLRTGDFRPTGDGAALMPVAAGVSPTVIELGKLARRAAGDHGGDSARADGRPCDALRLTTEFADFAEASNRRDALELELRGPDGAVVPTEWIDVRDTELLLALGRDETLAFDDFDGVEPDEVGIPIPDCPICDELCDDALDDFDEMLLREELDAPDDFEPDLSPTLVEDGEREYPRYQLQVMLLDDSAIP